MKKTVYLLIMLMVSSSTALAITEEDKAHIRQKIDEGYKYVYFNPEPEARDKAKEYVKDTYFYEYIKCKNDCETLWDYTRAKTRNNSQAKEVFNSCMIKYCNDIKEILIKECYDYIDEYIELKNKNRKK